MRVDNEIVQKNGCISRDIRRIRAGIGMIFQQFNLVERMSVARNVMLGALARHQSVAQPDRCFPHG